MELITLANNKPAFLLRKPSLLKDYLLDDLSSCSSSGFRSYPRRQQCCTSVRFLLDTDMKSKKSRPSAFKRASAAVINAVKSSYKLKLARKLLKRSFWKRPDPKQIQCGLVSGSPAKSLSSGESLSSTSDSKSKSSSWSDSDFTVSDGNSGTVENDNNGYEKRGPKNKAVSVSKREGVIVGGGDDSSSTNSSTNSNNLKIKEEEKEQFSPVSVLDCPFDDDDEVTSSPFQHRLARMEGTKKRLMRKIKKFEKLTHLEPVNLEDRIALSFDSSDHESIRCHSSDSTIDDHEDNEDEENDSGPDRSCQLLHELEASTNDQKADFCDILLLDFFKEGVEMGSVNRNGRIPLDRELINEARDWINGQPREVFKGWEDQKNREAYIRDIENAGKWRDLNEEKNEVALELEVEVFASLVDELCQDLLP